MGSLSGEFVEGVISGVRGSVLGVYRSSGVLASKGVVGISGVEVLTGVPGSTVGVLRSGTKLLSSSVDSQFKVIKVAIADVTRAGGGVFGDSSTNAWFTVVSVTLLVESGVFISPDVDSVAAVVLCGLSLSHGLKVLMYVDKEVSAGSGFAAAKEVDGVLVSEGNFR